MKRNALKKMTRSALSLLLIASLFTGLGFACSSAYAMNEGEEMIEEAANANQAVVEADPVQAEETAPAAETLAEAVADEKAAAEITEEVTEEVMEEVPAAEEMALMMMSAPAADEAENENEPAAAQSDETDFSEEITEEAAAVPAPKYIYYNNENHDITIEVYEDGRMVCIVSNTEAAGEDLAIVQIHDSTGSVLSGAMKEELKEMVTNLTLGEGILGVGWSSYNYHDNPEKTDVFHGFDKLTEVNPSSTLEVIGWSAFRKCYNLTNFDFSKCANLTTVMQQAFSNTGLKSADFSGTQVDTIGHGAFENCTSLEEVSIPSTVTSIYDQAFSKCGGIQQIEYNAAVYETSIQQNGKENPYFASAIFSASKNNEYTLVIGTDVEVLPQGFFKAFLGAAEISFSGMEDEDDCTVSGRSLTVNEGAGYSQAIDPFRNLSSDCVVDENGVLYEKKSDTLQITYFSPELTQYTLPGTVQVSEETIAVADLGDYANSKVAGTVTFRIEASDELAGVDAAELPDFKISDTVLVLKNEDGSTSFKPFSAADLTGNAAYSVTVENEDGSRTVYSFSLSGWAMEDGTVLALDEAVSLSGEVSLTSVWDIVREDIPAPAPIKQDKAAAPKSAPAAAHSGVQEATIDQNIEELNDTPVPLAKPVNADVVYPASSLSAVREGTVEETPEIVESNSGLMVVAVLFLVIAAMLYVIIRNRKDEND